MCASFHTIHPTYHTEDLVSVLTGFSCVLMMASYEKKLPVISIL